MSKKKTEKETVWERLSTPPRKRGVMLSPGVYVRDLAEVEQELRKLNVKTKD